MDKLAGKKVSRGDLFEQDNGSSRPSKRAKAGNEHLDGMLDQEDEQDFAAFERMMEARIKEQIGESISINAASSSSSESDADDQLSKNSNKKDGKDSAAPVFRLFAGVGPVKVETELVEPAYIQPQRPESSMVESDSEEHWRNLAAAAIDSQAVIEMSKIPLPAMAFSHRVIHIKADGTTGNDSAQVKEAAADKQKRRKKRKARRPEPYRKTPSPYNGGVIKAKMLEDLIREQEKAANALRARAASRGRGRGASRGIGRGRGRGGSFSGSGRS
ncbi:hypothetical protein LPJ64_004241 [Coemansia asiatica]|uniref:Uncharacterized protein n=1 Tax=Coemansia asiatica TaxID=1052880 RepID=A0A9W7XGH4_9FUNG|nr:hypothetical protein LPJ64_004241 [Coemansia asiatica]KAJ2887773.1 hypothetical protein FB639_001088 [Coemansia asiatica]